MAETPQPLRPASDRPIDEQRPRVLRPRLVRLDASTLCQLACPSCPTATGATGRRLGRGNLRFEDFRDFVRRNRHVSHIELSNWGEVFLNKDLDRILQHAYRRNVRLSISNGANLNHVRPEVIDSLVRYRLHRITCSIDGASQETYVQYRVNGDLERVLENVRAIQAAKARHRTKYPALVWQFVAFGHNEHEIARARAMAGELGMTFVLKLSWEDLYGLPDLSPVRDRELIARESGLGVASRKEYLARYGESYVERSCCWDLWKAPQINHDGRVLGCPINYWGDYGNAFQDGLDAVLNGEKMRQARAMLRGQVDRVPGLPCSTCKVYEEMRESQAWVQPEEIEPTQHPGRFAIWLENKVLGERLVRVAGRVRGRLRRITRRVLGQHKPR